MDPSMYMGLCPKNCRIVLPTAPLSDSQNDGVPRPSWYDINDVNPQTYKCLSEIRSKYDLSTLNESVDFVKRLVQEEAKTLPNQDVGRILIGGFSQGCGVSLATLL